MNNVSHVPNFSDDFMLSEVFLDDKPPVAIEPSAVLEVEEAKADEHSEEPHRDIMFTLPLIPGAEDQSDIEIDESEGLETAVSEGDIEVGESDPWNWQALGLKNFLDWVKARLENVPRHSGKDTTGLEKAISYFEAIDKEITRAMRMDYKNEIDSAKAEEARAEIENGLERLVDRLNKVRTSKYKRYQKKNKKADVTEAGIVKSAQKIPGISGIVVTVPLLISRLARICINGSVSGGHNIEDVFSDVVKEWSLDKREQTELETLIHDMGYPIIKPRDVPPGESAKRSDESVNDWGPANYPG